MKMPTPHEIEWTPDQIARFWDYQSHRPSAESNYFSVGRGQQIIQRTLRRVARTRAARVLDFGCGSGHLLRFLGNARPDLQLHGVDFSPESIRAARETCGSLQQPPDLRAATALPTEWPDGSFDAIYSVEVVEHLADGPLDAMAREAWRLLAPGGYLVITTPSNEDLESHQTCCPGCNAVFHIWQHQRSWSTASLSHFMSSHGFRTMLAVDTFLEPTHVRLLLWIARTVGLMHTKPPHILAIFQRQRGATRHRRGDDVQTLT